MTTAQLLIGGGLAVLGWVLAFAAGVWAGRPSRPRAHAGRRGRRDSAYLSGRSPVHGRAGQAAVMTAYDHRREDLS
ncbi:MAG TPA: hypothetical protein VFM54_13310 [Micromonosporaceae bacterium]|nr:hypothetical protein [Micromonosporaceae bacterium]